MGQPLLLTPSLTSRGATAGCGNHALISSITNELTAAGLAEDVNTDDLLSKVDISLGEMDFSVATLTDLPATVSYNDEAGLDALNTDSVNVKDIVSRLKTAQELKAKYDTLIAEATERAYDNIAPIADEVLAKIEAGEDWDELTATYNDDPGMNSGDTAVNGYAVCENMSGFDSAFVEAAMGISEIGGTSDKARGIYGYYIVKYVSDVQEGAISLDDVREDIESTLLSNKKDSVYTETVEGWVNAAGAFIDLKALND